METLSVADRRKKISIMIDQDMTTTTIAKRLNLPIFIVRADRVALSAPVVAPRVIAPKPVHTNIDERRAAVREMYLRGIYDPEIADALGVSKTMVWRDRGAMGLPALRATQHGDLQSQIREMFNKNMTPTEIAAATGSHKNSVFRHIKKMGLTRDQMSRDERREAVHRMHKNNDSANTIAKALGISKMTVYRDIERSKTR